MEYLNSNVNFLHLSVSSEKETWQAKFQTLDSCSHSKIK